MTRRDDPADQRDEQAEQEAAPGLEPPQQPSVNQVRDQPFPASHHDQSREEGLNPAEGETSDEDQPA